MLLLFLFVVSTAVAGCAADRPFVVLAIDFSGQQTNIEESISFSSTSRPAASLYDGTDFDRPEEFTAHDLMVRWSRDSGVPIETTYFDCCGYSLEAIDDVSAWFQDDAGRFWELSVNGEVSTKGMSTTVVMGGDQIAWTYAQYQPSS